MYQSRSATGLGTGNAADGAVRIFGGESAGISHTTAIAVLRHRRTIECELSRVQESNDVRKIVDLVAELRRLDEWLMCGAT